MLDVWTTKGAKYTKTAKEKISFFAPFATFAAFVPPVRGFVVQNLVTIGQRG